MAVGAPQTAVGSVYPWSEDLTLSLGGELSEGWKVRYLLKQFPAAQERYAFSLNSGNYSLLLGDPEQYLAGQEYILQDHLSGYGAAGRWGDWRAALFAGPYPDYKSASNTAYFTETKQFRDPRYKGQPAFNYTNDNPYLEFLGLELQRLDIVSESITAFADNKQLVEGVDYIFDPEQGLLLIIRTWREAKELKVSFRASNGENKELSFIPARDGRRRAFLFPEYRIVDGSETLTIDGLTYQRDLDYRADYSAGLFVMKRPVNDDAEVRISCQNSCGASLYTIDTLSGQTGLTFKLTRRHLIANSETVTKNGQQLTRATDYTMNSILGQIIFTTALTAADTVEVAYSYNGIGQVASGANLEYAVADWAKVGASTVSLSPNNNDSTVFNDIAPSKYTITNFYGQAAFNTDTFLRAEYAQSSQLVDYRSGGTTEADNALKLSGRTKLGRGEFFGNYRKSGVNFASVRKVKLNESWGDERWDIGLKFGVADDRIIIRGTSGKIKGGQNSNTTQEIASDVFGGDIDLRPFDFWTINLLARTKQDELPGTAGNTTALNRDSECYSSWEFSKAAKLIVKCLDATQKNNIASSGAIVAIDRKLRTQEYGLIGDLQNGLTDYLSYKNEQEDDLVAGTSVTRATPYNRLTYRFGLWDWGNFQLSYDYSQTQQRGSSQYDKKDTAVGLSFELPVSNPVLESFNVGGYLKNTDYADPLNPLNNYQAKNLNFSATMVF